MDCYEAPDGQTALAYCDRVNFDIIFLDCNMPGMDGLATLDRLRLRSPDARVVMISGETGRNYEARALKRGASAFLQKPFRPIDVDAVLHRLFGLRLPDLMTWDGQAPDPAASRTEALAPDQSAAITSGGRNAAARA
jgi:DNA-binding response OmpR family regulator